MPVIMQQSLCLLNPGTHAGVKQMIGLHFVATGRMSRELGRCFPYFSNVGIVVIMMILPIQARKK